MIEHEKNSHIDADTAQSSNRRKKAKFLQLFFLCCALLIMLAIPLHRQIKSAVFIVAARCYQSFDSNPLSDFVMYRINGMFFDTTISLTGHPDNAVSNFADTCLYGTSPTFNPAQVEIIREQLHSANPKNRYSCINALSKISGTEQDLLPFLQDPEPLVRAMAARAMGNMHFQPAQSILVSLLKDSDPTVRYYTLEALRYYSDPALVPGILPLLYDKQDYVRSKAAEILAAKGDPRAIPALEKVVTTPGQDAYTIEVTEKALKLLKSSP